MAEHQYAEAQKQPERARTAREDEREAPSLAMPLQRVSASFQGGRLDPHTLTPQAILALQRTVGNAAVNHLLAEVAHPPAHMPNPSTTPVVQRDTISTGDTSVVKVGRPVPSREAPVYIPGDGSVYKAFSNRGKAEAVLEGLTAARDAMVPVPKWKSYEAILTPDDDTPRKVYVVQSEFIHGEVFYAAKGGGPTIFANIINKISSPDTLRKMRHTLAAAKQIRMTDPQGFVTADSIIFFDVHVGKGTGEAVTPLIEAVAARMKTLGIA